MKPGLAGIMAGMAAFVLFAEPGVFHAQRGRGGGGQPAAGRGARSAAPYDLTGYWVSVVSEDWKYRMVTPPKGEYGGVPISAEGRKVADGWDPAKDEAAGTQCKAYGAAGIMRIPTRLHITWENDDTLRIDTDAGTQTRLLRFGAPDASPDGDLTWQGRSAAQWDAAGGRGTRFAEGNLPERGGFIKVVTTRMRPGYLRKNGVPYSSNATLTEYFESHLGPNNERYLVVSTVIEDSQYLSQPYVTSANFKKLPDASGWSPTPCSAK